MHSNGKRMLKRAVGAVLAAGMAAALLTGCGGSSGSGGASKTAAKTIRIWAWDVALMQLQEAGEKYQKDHPDITFEYEEMGTDQIYKKLSTSLATGNGIADVIAIEGEYLVGYADKFPEGFLDLSGVVPADDILSSKMAEVTYKDKVHAFPWDAGPEGLFYRTDYFEQAGVDAASIKTWDDLIEAGKKIESSCTTKDGNPVKMIPVDPRKTNFYNLMLGQLGQGVFDENGKPQVDSELSIKAMEEAAKVYASGVCLNYNGWDEYEQCVVNESVACIPEAVWMIGTIKDKAPDTSGSWSAIPMPMIDGGSYSCNNGGSDLAVNAKTAYPDEVKDFVKFALTDTALQASGFEKYGLYPSYTPSYQEKVFEEGDSFFTGGNVYSVFIESGENIAAIPTSPNTLEANDSISAAVSRIMLNGDDVESTMKGLEKELGDKFQ